MVEISRLANGLTVATDHMAEAQSAAVGIWVRAGTRHEQLTNNGVAHFLEHMAFKGTASRSAFDIACEVESVGGIMNAYTSREMTAYYLRVLSEHVPLAIDILADILSHSTFLEEELERERTVILQEIGQSLDTPDDIIFDHFQSTAYADQAMGYHVLGSAQSVNAMQRKDMTDFMNVNYVPSNMVLCAAGAVNHADILKLAGDLFGERPANRVEIPESPIYSPGEYREESDLEQVHIILGMDGFGLRSPDHYSVHVFSTLLGGGMSSRLFQEVREKRGLAYSIFSFLNGFQDSGLFGIYAGTSEKDANDLIKVIQDELNNMRRVDTDELERAKAQLKAGMLMSRESCGGRAEQLANQILIYGREIPVNEIIRNIEEVSAQDITRLADHFLVQQPVLTLLGPVSNIKKAA